MEFQNKTALVSGSRRGIGLGVAERLLAGGARVVLNGRNASELEIVCKALQERFGQERVLSFVGDLTHAEDIERCVSYIRERCDGHIDILVSNVGSGKSVGGPLVDSAEWQRMFDINFLGTVSLVQAIVPLMQAQGSGSIVCVSSIAGVTSIGAPLAYSAAKAAVISYTQGLAKQLAADGIRVNAVAPGNVLFTGGRWEEILAEDPTKKETVLAGVPMKRFGTLSEIAHAVAYLASSRASFVTGECLVVDGGQIL